VADSVSWPAIGTAACRQRQPSRTEARTRPGSGALLAGGLVLGHAGVLGEARCGIGGAASSAGRWAQRAGQQVQERRGKPRMG